MTKRLCYHIASETEPGENCQAKVEFLVWFGFEPGPADYKECCGEHLRDLLDLDFARFEILRIYESSVATEDDLRIFVDGEEHPERPVNITLPKRHVE